jgi:hypothetical protein
MKMYNSKATYSLPFLIITFFPICIALHLCSLYSFCVIDQVKNQSRQSRLCVCRFDCEDVELC